MLTLKRLFSWGLPGWFFFGWAVMNELSTAQTTAAVFRSIFEFVNKYPAAGVFLGVVWLTLVATWPKWKPDWLRIPRTVLERLTEVEGTHIPKLDKLVAGLSQQEAETGRRLDGLTVHVDKCVGIVDADGKATAEIVKRHAGLLSTLATSLETYRAGLGEIADDLSDLKKSAAITCDALNSKLDVIQQRFAAFGLSFSRILLKLQEVNGLIFEYATSIKYLEEIKDRYPQTEAARKPFSKQWSRMSDDADVPLLVIEWATFHEHLVARCNLAASQTGHSLMDLTGGTRLLSYTTWDIQDNMDACVREMVSQRNNLFALRTAYADNLDRSIALKDTSS